ncbi:glycosyltransferase family 4 protein [Candidatus Omnitrophota bacterium]
MRKGGGQDRVNYEIAFETLRRGHQVILIANSLSQDLREHREVEWICIPVRGGVARIIHEILFAWRSAHWIWKNRREVDLVLVNGSNTWAAADINMVHFVHSVFLKSAGYPKKSRLTFDELYHKLYTGLNAYLERWAFRRSKAVVAVSKKIKGELVNIGVPEEKISVIVNGVDLSEFYPGPADRAKLGLPEGVPLAVFAGDIQIPRKNLETVLYALVRVPELNLAVIGHVKKQRYPDLVAQLGLERRVHFLGYRRDIANIMRAADIFVFPSRYEAFGLVLLEALASGLPIVTASSTGGAEIITDKCGIIVHDPDDVEALANALKTLVNDPSRREKMSISARGLAEQYSWHRTTQEYMHLFERSIA